MDEKPVTDYMSDVYDVICGTMQIDNTRDICPNQVIAIDAYVTPIPQTSPPYPLLSSFPPKTSASSATC